jgi:hypothetical protein
VPTFNKIFPAHRDTWKCKTMYVTHPEIEVQESRFADQETEADIFNGAIDYID